MVFELNWKHSSIGLCHGLRRETEDTAGLLMERQRHSGVTESPWGTGMKPGSRDEAAESHISEKCLSAFVGGHHLLCLCGEKNNDYSSQYGVRLHRHPRISLNHILA